MADLLRVSDFVTHDVNPSLKFINGLQKLEKREYEKIKVLITEIDSGDTHEDEITHDENYIVNGHHFIDRARFTKLFRGSEDEIRNLSSSAVCVLMYVIKNLKNGFDEIRLDAEDCRVYMGYKSKKSVYDGIFGLLKAEFIYRKTGWECWYFINVNKIFNGQRAKLKQDK